MMIMIIIMITAEGHLCPLWYDECLRLSVWGERVEGEVFGRRAHVPSYLQRLSGEGGEGCGARKENTMQEREEEERREC